ncbi:glycosyltransferase family 4 protein [Crassaminicella profunda]|uniref:glycosyltransferase family 4 protein n=1 Tax=Crassaminicella profunda TaxID=1286698 RepID=UPI001CA79EB7|nr:glycosyltransferase family 4 protein [Crassaminicella profunda]QZY55555.1 glycosyltransferase family 4 protein [Crassaminicella profunda]
MKIIIQNRYYYPSFGGVENSLYYIACELTRKGHEVTILTKKLDKDSLDVEKTSEGFEIIRYDYRIPKILFFVDPLFHYNVSKKKMDELLKEKEFDLIITRDPVLGLASYNCKLNKIKLLYIPPVIIKYSYVGRIHLKKNIKRQIIELLGFIRFYLEGKMQQILLKECNNIIVFSNNIKSQIEEYIKNINKKKISVIPPGVDSSFKIINENTLFEKYNLSKETKIFLYVGRIVNEKYVDLLLDAFIKLDQDSSILMFVGDGAELNELKRKADKFNIKNKVVFAGYKKNTVEFYNLATYLVLPTKYEAFGQVILESLACGTPVIGFRNNKHDIKVATDEIITDAQTGFLCDQFSVECLSKTMEKALQFSNNEIEYNLMKERCLQKAKKEYTWDKFTDELLLLCGKETD